MPPRYELQEQFLYHRELIYCFGLVLTKTANNHYKLVEFESTSNKLTIVSLKTKATDSICSKIIQSFHRIRAVNVLKILCCIGLHLLK